MRWRLFLDDIRFPPKGEDEWIICRNFDDAAYHINAHGFPYHISFDHDLGLAPLNGKDFADFIIEQDLDQKWSIPDNFTFYVHSANPIGAQNICDVLNQYLKIKKAEKNEKNESSASATT